MTEMPPAGWYPDGSGKTRWWNGEAWTDWEQPSVQRSTSPPSDPSQGAQTTFSNHVDSFVSEGEDVDKGLGLVIDGVAIFGASGIAAVVSPEVARAAQGGWFAVFFATLTLSLSVAIVVFLMQSGRKEGPELIGIAFFAALVSSGIAYIVGTGYLDLVASTTHSGPQAFMLLQFVGVAFQTYGVLGTILGAGVGAWIGYRLAKAFPVEG